MAWRHGTKYGYLDKKCRCDACRAAAMAYRKRWRDRSREAGTEAYQRELALSRALKERYRGVCEDCGGKTSHPSGKGMPRRCVECERKRLAANRLPCGTRASYVRGCRCRPCTDAAIAYARQFKKPKVAA